ncbi:putative monooxygenase [Eremomyces bilateralis CBS 781.70]|uniref:Monooxygenase n=1 Tax=Eremomyces bilateralis CBS 781.70 TaxID=1392243 RepID=A0A6G1G425_9PEZI|nr:putative monooxygenase [Eremomyces bilateralis CBS 781.70]KAF1812670.1 putative monooxygenase [Eremomyces bilateralis CBS 781.70]
MNPAVAHQRHSTTPRASSPSARDHLDDATRPPFYPEARPLDPDQPVKIIIVGAGLAGIITAILLSYKVRNLSYVIYDKNTKLGGTWAENVYPGVRCDVPSHCYQTTFAPNHHWSEYYSRGHEIREYYESIVNKYNVRSHIQFRKEVIRATWIPNLANWEIQVKNMDTGVITTDTAPFFINAQGRLSKPQMPDIPGLMTEYKGPVLHTAVWDVNYDLTGKRVAVIGNGASGQQIVPNILPKVAHLDHYVRSKVWVTPSLQKNTVQAEAGNPGGYQYTKEDIRKFNNDPEEYVAYRRTIEKNLHERFQRTILGSEDNEELREACIKTMSRQLNGSKEWLDRLLPDFAPGCKRLTPAPGYLEALQDEKVTFVQDRIDRVTAKGIVTSDGQERVVDLIIAATGFSNGFVPYFPTVGRNGVDISKDWANGGAVGYPETYFGIMAPDMPNYFFILQAQSNGGGGSIPLQCEISATYIAKVIRKLQLQSYRSITPSREAVEDFNDLCLGYFQDKVVSDTCSSWLKSSGPKPRTLVWWPGSGHHRIMICREPRWEDFDYDRSGDAKKNRYAYFGSGWTERERIGGVEKLTSYLKAEDKVDLELLHEYWNK